MLNVWQVVVALGLILGMATSTFGQTARKMADLTLEELLNVRIVTVTRTGEGASDAPGVVEVVTAA